MSVGGAGAGAKYFLQIIEHLLPLVREKKVALFLNLGDHLDMFEYLKKHIKGFDQKVITHKVACKAILCTHLRFRKRNPMVHAICGFDFVLTVEEREHNTVAHEFHIIKALVVRTQELISVIEPVGGNA